ncbi:MAG: metallophosphoesterase [Candidatus Helarchaeota archaeon]|nr:metallophosphoesterase [Candidatus Helarchaeota archaeon]
MKRIAYCSDLHGKRERYLNFYSIEADYHIIGGDLFPRHGIYFKRLIDVQRNFIDEFLKPLLEQNKERTQTLLMLGNDDLEPLECNILEMQEDGLCHFLHGNKISIEDFEVIGFKYVPPTPFSLKNIERRDSRGISQKQFGTAILFQNDGMAMKIDFEAYLKSQPSIAELLDTLPKPTDFSKAIYVMHSPPYNSLIDTTVQGESVGSLDIRNFILKYQPTLVLCGHIHESPGTIQLGNTTCINPGQLHDFAYSLFELENDSIEFLKIPPPIKGNNN